MRCHRSVRHKWLSSQDMGMICECVCVPVCMCMYVGRLNICVCRFGKSNRNFWQYYVRVCSDEEKKNRTNTHGMLVWAKMSKLTFSPLAVNWNSIENTPKKVNEFTVKIGTHYIYHISTEERRKKRIRPKINRRHIVARFDSHFVCKWTFFFFPLVGILYAHSMCVCVSVFPSRHAHFVYIYYFFAFDLPF